MPMKWTRTVAAVSSAALVTLLATGCHVSDKTHGDSDNVRISTPFGGMQVKTDNTAILEQIGLPAYPGATLVKNKDDKGSADVNLHFGSFHLKVNAAGYRTADSPDMVKAFYRKALTKYGDVIECHDGKTVGTPTKTADGLTCNDQGGAHIQVSHDLTGKTQLRAGSRQHQHIVDIDPEGSGTKFGLVALDLPGRMSFGHDDKSTQ